MRMLTAYIMHQDGTIVRVALGTGKSKCCSKAWLLVTDDADSKSDVVASQFQNGPLCLAKGSDLYKWDVATGR
jgi:hypothetical protein